MESRRTRADRLGSASECRKCEQNYTSHIEKCSQMQHAASQIRRYPKKLQGETETLGEKFYSKRLTCRYGVSSDPCRIPMA
jgi:hypothetical protein